MTGRRRIDERQELRRLSRRRRRGGHRRAPMPVQRAAARVGSAVARVRAAAHRAVSGNRPFVVALLGALVLGLVMLSGPTQRYFDHRARVATLEAKADALDAEIARLEQRRDDLNDPTHLELLAREQQGFIFPGEVPYTLIPPEVDQPRIATPRQTTPAPEPPWYQRAWEQVRSWFG